MNYKSTRDNSIGVTSAKAIAQGLSEEGGLFVPENIPALTKDDILSLCDKTYPERALLRATGKHL